MNSKLKNMYLALNIGSVILFLAGLGILLTPDIDSVIIKLCGSMSICCLLLVFSLVLKKILNTCGSSKIQYYFGLILFVTTYIFGGLNDVYGTYFGYGLEGAEIFYASIFLLICILAVLTRCVYKSSKAINLAFVSMLFMLYHLFLFFGFSYQLILIVIGILLIVLLLINKNFNINVLISFSYLYVLVNLLLGFDDNILFVSILFVISIINILVSLYKDKFGRFEIIGLVVLAFSLLVFDDCLSSMEIRYIILVFTSCLIELFVNYFKLIKHNRGLFFALINIIFAILLVMSFNVDAFTFVIASLFITISSLVMTFILKCFNDKLCLLKVFILLFALLNFINSIVRLDGILYVYILILIGINIFTISNNKNFKITAQIISTFLLVFLVHYTINSNLFYYFISAILIVLEYVIFGLNNKTIDANLNEIMCAIEGIALYALTYNASSPLIYFISCIGLLVILILSRKNSVNFIVLLLILYLTFSGYISLLSSNFIITNDSRVILNSILFIILIILITTRYVQEKNTFITTMGSLFIAYLLIQYTSVSVYLFVLVVSLISLVYGILYKEFKGLFYLGLFGTIISILALISNIGNLPIVLYFVIIGIILIVTISVFIYKYQKYLVDGRYKRCINCDGKQDVDNKYCEYCGFPFVSKNNYCGECGSKILGDENYCRNCGNKLK